MPATPDPRGNTPGQLIDELCDSFEDGWQSGAPVPLESVVLSAPEAVRPPLFRELLAIEGEYRAKAFQPITAAEAQERFARLGPWTDALIREILAATGTWGAPHSASVSAAPPPALNVIGPYELLRELGRGAHGTVYKARHTRLKRMAALKVLFPHRAHTPDALERFYREVEVLARLNHPNVVRATNADFAQGYHYLAMEFVDGADLGRVLHRAERLSVPDACEVGRQAAEGLAELARHGMTHRDIKPSNLLLGRDGVVRVADLGLVRWDKTILGEGFTETGEVMGTTDYIAPEQAQESHEVDVRADIYSLGCTLYALLTGAPPFAGVGGNPLQKFKAHAEAPVPPLAPRCPDAPPGLIRLVLRMLAKDPDLRPQSPADVAREIAPFCTGHALVRLLPPASAEPHEPPALPQLMPRLAEGEASTGQAAPTADHLPEPRLRRRVRLLVAVVPAALAMCAVLWLALKPEVGPVLARITVADHTLDTGTSGSPPGTVQAPTQPALPPRVFKPKSEYDLLDRPPTILAWPRPDKPEDAAASTYTFKEVAGGRKTLTVTSRGTAMIQLENVPDMPFDLEIKFAQTPWLGGVGVFARGRPVLTAPWARLYTDTDCLLIKRFEKIAKPTQVAVGRSRTNVSLAHHATPLGIRPRSVPYTGGSDHTLRLTVGPLGPERLVLDRHEFDKTLFQTGEGESTRTGAHGSVGVIVDGHTVVVQSARLFTH